MAYVNPQVLIDQQQNQRNDQNQAAIGQGIMSAVQSVNENRRRAVDARKGIIDTTATLRGHGYDVNEDQVGAAIQNGDFGSKLFDKRTAEYTGKLEREAADRSAKTKLEEAKTNYYNRKGSANSPGSKESLTYQEKLDLKAKKDAEVKAAEQANPNYKLEKIGSEGRSKVGAIASGLQALDHMDKAGVDGFGPTRLNADTPIIGNLVSDTPYTEGERTVGEVIGRLQSGGAINDGEVKTFRALGPRPGDDAATRTRKLGQQKDFLTNKLTAFGMSHDDLNALGFETKSKYVPKAHVDKVKGMSDEELAKYVNGDQ